MGYSRCRSIVSSSVDEVARCRECGSISPDVHLYRAISGSVFRGYSSPKAKRGGAECSSPEKSVSRNGRRSPCTEFPGWPNQIHQTVRRKVTLFTFFEIRISRTITFSRRLKNRPCSVLVRSMKRAWCHDQHQSGLKLVHFREKSRVSGTPFPLEANSRQ